MGQSMLGLGGVRALGRLGLGGLVGALNLSCGISEKSEAGPIVTTGTRTSTDAVGGSGGNDAQGGSGGNAGESASSSGGSGGSGGAPMTDTDTTTTSANLAGAPGAAGAGPVERDPLTCDSFADEDPHGRCEPKLRALLSSIKSLPLLTFEYDEAGRLATVGDERSHASYFRHRYSYDDQGRVSRIESDCYPKDRPGTCTELHEFSYAAAGWLQTTRYTHDETIPGYYDQWTYDEDGKLLEELSATPEDTHGRLYQYRTDGQPEAQAEFDLDDNGIRNVYPAEVMYEYGDDDVLDRVVHDAEEYVEYEYVVEDGRVRVEHVDHSEAEFDETVVFDDFGRPAFQDVVSQGSDEWVIADVDGIQFNWGYADSYVFEARHAIVAPQRLLPYRPLDLTPADIDDFRYSYGNSQFERRVSFSEDGLLETLTHSWELRWQSFAVTIDTQRCGGVVIETTHFPSYDGPDDEVSVYLYGCDDFVLPTPLPEL